MKKILTAVMALFIIGLVQAQDKPASTAPQPAAQPASQTAAQPAAAKADMKNCCTMKAGKMVQIKDGKETAMTEDVKLSNGIIIHADGSVTREGKKTMLKEGEYIDMTGTMGRMRQPRTSTTESVPPSQRSTPSQAEPAK